MRPAALLTEIEALVRETFALWEVVRVGFSWQHYYFNHTQRVRNLALHLAAQEGTGTDRVKLECAALLHDLTKRYDGDILTDAQGRRIVDERGFWRNERVLPARSNRVTDLYERLGLAGQMHHLSAATLAEHLLLEYGCEPAFCRDVGEIIRGHVRPAAASEEEHRTLYRLAETRLLQDADIIDPNVGLTAFYRNIQIHAGRAWQEGRLLEIEAYLETLPRWIDSKEAFLDRTLTAAGRCRAAARQRRNRELLQALQAEYADHRELNQSYGLLGVVQFLRGDAADPSLHRHAWQLCETWLPSRKQQLARETGCHGALAEAAWQRSVRFAADLQKEIAGEL